MQTNRQHLGYSRFDLGSVEYPQLRKQVGVHFEPELMVKHRFIPIYTTNKSVKVAISDFTNLDRLNEYARVVKKAIEPVYSEQEDIDRLLECFENGGVNAILQDSLEDIDLMVEEDIDDDEEIRAEDGPVVKYVNKILYDAIKLGVSDIHWEPFESRFRVRYRMDGVLHEIAEPPFSIRNRILARLKIMAKMDISERRRPQDGRIKMKFDGKTSIDFRVNTLPSMYGEKIVMRLLDVASAQMGIDSLGYEPEQKKLYLEALQKPQGMILVTGPTGSGKTVSLYTGLGILNKTEVNISTAEDPVEINMDGITQVPVNPKIGFGFAEALRSFLRQDPDIIMVGEIRDLETADISVKASQTGHLVLSTLHTNSASDTVTRLQNMGVPSYNIAASVSLIIAQRLARTLCEHCSEPLDLPENALRELGFSEEMIASHNIRKPVGCDHCQDGYKGRTGIYEVVKMTRPIAEKILSGANSIELNELFRKEGFNDLRQSALRKCARGQISIEEVNRVTID